MIVVTKKEKKMAKIKRMDYANDYNSSAIMWSKINEIIDVLNELTAPVIGKGEEKCKTTVDLIIDAIRNIGVSYSKQDLKDVAEILKRK